jgi:thioredoxin 1
MASQTFEATTGNFQAEVLNSSLPVLVDFGADWCPPCKMLEPVVDDLARKYEGKLRVASMDADANPDIIMQYGVMGLPTLILFQGGQPVGRIVGYVPREKLEAKLLSFLQPEET